MKTHSSGPQQCQVSENNRFLVLSTQESRNSTMSQIKHLLKSVEVQLSNKLITLIYQIYLDAQYKERTNLQMKEMIVSLQDQLAMASVSSKEPETVYSRALSQQQDIYSKRQSARLATLQRKMVESYTHIERLTRALEDRQKENNQLKNQLANSCVDYQTEQLIQQLTIQLQNQKNKNRNLLNRCQMLTEELASLEMLLNDKLKMSRPRDSPE